MWAKQQSLQLLMQPIAVKLFQACEEAVERVKHEVPVFKEEFFTDGTSHYVEGCCIRKDTPRPQTPSSCRP